MKNKVLFLCHGNICRSVMAEIIFNHIMKDIDKSIKADSKALTNEEEGNDIYPPVKKLLKEKLGYTYSHIATLFKKSDYDEYDYIYIMDEENAYLIKRIIKDDYDNKIKRLGNYLSNKGDILDPWYTRDFESCYNEIYNAVLNVILKDVYQEFDLNYNEFIKKYKLMGTTSIIASNDKILEIGVSGYKDFENKEHTKLDTIYKVASISKIIVALGIMKLYEEGLLNLDDDISKYLGFKVRNPYYVEDIITLKMVLTQTSSLNDCGDGIKGYYGTSCGNIRVDLEDIIRNDQSIYYDKNVWLNKKPGTYFNYCNLGCGILACICEKITHKYFKDYIKEILLNPLDIKSGFKTGDILYPERLAVHYEYNEDLKEFELYSDYNGFVKSESPTFDYGNNMCGFAGGLYISLIDLTKIMHMLMNNGKYKEIVLFKESTIKKMKEVHWAGDSYDNAYKKKGLQLVILDGYKEDLMGHFGNAYGLRAFMLFNDKKGYIFASNGGDYGSNDDHLTPVLNDIINYLIRY